MSSSVVPFSIDVPQVDVADLKRRLASTRLPEPLTDVPDDLTGLRDGTLRSLLREWSEDYDWYVQQASLNRYPQFRTEIDGVNLHALHVCSARPDAVPLLLLHGWPSAFIEYIPLIEALISPTDPTLPAFHVVIPSLPGFGFSGPTLDLGWNNIRNARALAELMSRLGYERYLIHGSDVGQFVGTFLASIDAEHVLGLHINMGGIKAAAQNIHQAARDHREQTAFDCYREYVRDKSGYAVIQSTRPETLAYGLTDSPVGQLAWIAEKFYEWGDPAHYASSEHILTTASIYWFTKTSGSSARFYREEYAAPSPAPFVEVPTAVGVYPHDIAPAVRHWAERDYNITQWKEMTAGGHFAALEAPEEMLASLRKFAGSLSAHVTR